MSIRGSVVLECDSKGCHAELVIDVEDADFACDLLSGVKVEFVASDWQQDEAGDIRCPQCCEANPRQKGDDDGVEYADPRDERDERDGWPI